MTSALDNLPEGWTVSTLEALAEPKAIAYGVLKPGPVVQSGIPMVRVSDVRDGRIEQSAIYRISKDLDHEFRRTKLRGGEVVVSIQGSVGRVAVIPDDLAGANVSRTIAMIRLREPRLAQWVKSALESPHIQQAIRDAMGGTTRDSLNLRDLRQIEIPIAPEPERSTVLRVLERATQLTRSSSTHLASARGAVQRFREAVLAAACSGRLTSGWRSERGLQRPAQALADLRQRHEALPARERRGAVVESSMVDLDMTALPESWSAAPLKLLCEPGRPITYGILKPGPHVDDGVPYVRVTDFKSGTVSLPGIKRTSLLIAEAYRRSALRTGDLLFAIRGTYGHVATVPPELAGANITQDTARLTIDRAVSPDYILYALRAPNVQSRIRRAAKGVAVQGINLGDLRELLLPVPPYVEQLEIVRRIEELLSVADRLDDRLVVAGRTVARSSMAVLAKAFRGELLTAG